MTSHYADISRAWDIMDIMNNIEVMLLLSVRICVTRLNLHVILERK